MVRFIQRIARKQSDEQTTDPKKITPDPKKITPSLFAQIVGDEKGATAIEYVLIVAGIAIAILGVVFAVGDEISNMFKNIQELLAGRDPGPG